MKKAILLPLIALLSNVAFAQYMYRYKSDVDSLQQFIHKDSVLTFYPDFQSRNTEDLMERLKRYDEQLEKMKIAATRRHNGMPIFKPQGFHHLLINPPNPSYEYSLIIIPKPEKSPLGSHID